MEKWLSRHVIIDGTDVGLSVVTINGTSVTVNLFEQESEAVAYTDYKIIIDTSSYPSTVKFVNTD